MVDNLASNHWQSWNQGVTTTGTTITTWSNWLTYDSTATTNTRIVYANEWTQWNSTYKVSYMPWTPVVPEPLTAEEIAREARLAAARQRDNDRLIKVAAREHAIAERKARRLLLAHLTPEQRDEFERLQRFHVVGADGKLYRINRGWAGNLQLIETGPDGGFITEQLCVHPREQTPVEDNMLIQKLMLETVPAELRRIANVTRMRRAA